MLDMKLYYVHSIRTNDLLKVSFMLLLLHLVAADISKEASRACIANFVSG